MTDDDTSFGTNIQSNVNAYNVREFQHLQAVNDFCKLGGQRIRVDSVSALHEPPTPGGVVFRKWIVVYWVYRRDPVIEGILEEAGKLTEEIEKRMNTPMPSAEEIERRVRLKHRPWYWPPWFRTKT